MQKDRPLIIAGPTASGKSAIAVAWAKEMDGVIINADSMQIYQDLPILTAHPSLEDMASCPHRLYGVLPGSQACSVAMWVELVLAEIKTAQRAGQRPLLVGGTGMYLLNLMNGLSHIPDIDPAIRQEARELSTSMPIIEFYKKVIALDPLIEGHLNMRDTQRLSRAYEVIRSTGKSIVAWQSMPTVSRRDQYEIYLVSRPRAELHQRATHRFNVMLENGALSEVSQLIHQSYAPDLPVMRALGVKELSSFLRQEISLEEAKEKAIIATRQYIKRQSTFFKNQFPEAKLI